MGVPSVRTLEAAFPTKGKALRRLLVDMTAVRAAPAVVAWVSQCHNEPQPHELRLCALNAELEGHGVEHVNGTGVRAPSFDYINMGDTYAATILRFTGGRYIVACWGDQVENKPYG
jgi:hypothetical protein